jgi:hypothetical protein
MDKQAKREVMDSLTEDQRKGIAKIICSADVEGDYTGMDDDGGSFCQEDVAATLSALASYFCNYDPTSVTD